MILDWHGEPIVNTLEERLNDKRERKEVYAAYVQGLQKVVGFPQEVPAHEGIRSWAELFNHIEQEYQRQSFLHPLFGSYSAFFNALFVNPYGVAYSQEGNFVDVISQQEKEEQKIAAFARTLNLPFLFFHALQQHQQKLKKFGEIIEKSDIPVLYEVEKGPSNEGVDPSFHLALGNFYFPGSGGENLPLPDIGKDIVEGTLQLGYSKNIWHHILSNSPDCIYITARENDLTFQKYWLASLLHLYHPNIFSLHFSAGTADLKKRHRFPLLQVLLMETTNQQYPLLVEGLLGMDLEKMDVLGQQYRGLADAIEAHLQMFFDDHYGGQGGSLAYNARHQIHRDKPAYQMVHFLRNKVVGRSRKKPLELQVALATSEIQQISLKGDYHGEQYSEAFADRTAKLGAFCTLEGRVKAICHEEDTHGEKRKGRRFTLPALYGLVSFFGLVSMTGSYFLWSEPDTPLTVIACWDAVVEDSSITCLDYAKKQQFRLSSVEEMHLGSSDDSAHLVGKVNGYVYHFTFKDRKKGREDIERQLVLKEAAEIIVENVAQGHNDPTLSFPTITSDKVKKARALFEEIQRKNPSLQGTPDNVHVAMEVLNFVQTTYRYRFSPDPENMAARYEWRAVLYQLAQWRNPKVIDAFKSIWMATGDYGRTLGYINDASDLVSLAIEEKQPELFDYYLPIISHFGKWKQDSGFRLLKVNTKMAQLLNREDRVSYAIFSHSLIKDKEPGEIDEHSLELAEEWYELEKAKKDYIFSPLSNSLREFSPADHQWVAQFFQEYRQISKHIASGDIGRVLAALRYPSIQGVVSNACSAEAEECKTILQQLEECLDGVRNSQGGIRGARLQTYLNPDTNLFELAFPDAIKPQPYVPSQHGQCP